MIESYRDLKVWQKALALVTEVYAVTGQYPATELYGLTSQIRRCAVSIPSNIAEGYGRHSSPDYARFLRTARGSLFELQTQLEISLNLEYIQTNDYTRLNDPCNELSKMLTALINKINPKGENHE